MNRHDARGRLITGLAAGFAGGWLLARRTPKQATMPHLAVWQREMAQTRGTVAAGFLAARIQARYDALWAQRPRFAQRVLDRHVRVGILPGLALYRVLQEACETQAAALAEAEQLFAVAYRGPAALFPVLKRFRDAFALFRAVARPFLSLQTPAAGWGIQPVEDSADSFAFDVRERCLYRDVLAAFGAPELTPVFCKVDDWVYGSLAPEIVFTRTKTLGRGDDCCDFRFCRGAAAPVGDKITLGGLTPVSQTLVLPLGYRAMETRRPDALLRDPMAVEIAARLDFDFSRMARQPFQQLNIALRAREFDRITRAFLAEHPAGVVTEIGCGLDTRFDRVDNGQATWFSLDFPEVIALRERLFAQQTRCRALATSALDLAWVDSVAATSGPYLFLAEGVLPYFTEAEVRRLVSALLSRFPGAELVFDAMPPLMARFSRLHPAIRQTPARAHWGLDDSRELEKRHSGARLLADWRYYSHSEPRLGLYRLLRHVPFFRDFRILHYRLG